MKVSEDVIHSRTLLCTLHCGAIISSNFIAIKKFLSNNLMLYIGVYRLHALAHRRQRKSLNKMLNYLMINLALNFCRWSWMNVVVSDNKSLHTIQMEWFNIKLNTAWIRTSITSQHIALSSHTLGVINLPTIRISNLDIVCKL